MPPLPPSPYPGLRAFRPEESLVFCGRAEHRAQVLDILGKARFLAVVGASGSGKSSLVLAGLLPDIGEGQLIGVDPESARIASMQPGLRPFAHLADALARGLGTDVPLEPVLRQGPMGLVRLLDELKNEPDRALVVVIDQFEEIFRFADLSSEELIREKGSYAGQPLLDGARNEAQAFVNLLLATAAQTRHSVYVLLTMRSDFLARCDQFNGLPEAISRSQFLTPRLNRQQLEQAITRPVQHFGATIQPELVNLILNQISTEQDQLPLMQHALARMWELKLKDGGAVLLTMDDYREVGGMAMALCNHGDSLCRELGEKCGIPLDQIERFFRCLAQPVSARIPPVRRPARVDQIASETGLSTDVVRKIADAFRAEGCHLLMPPMTRIAELRDDTFLDISHESLLRQWKRLKEWMDDEWDQRRMADELVSAMNEWSKTAPDESKGPVAKFQSWKQAGEAVATRVYREAQPVFFGPQAPPTVRYWARRYGIDWDKLAAFCEKAFYWKKMTSAASKAGVALFVVTTLMIYAFAFVLWQNHRISKLNTLAEKRRVIAEEQTQKAASSEAVAKLETKVAQENYQKAVQEKAEAQRNADDQTRTVQQALESLSNSAGDIPRLQELLDSPEIQPLLPRASMAAAGPPPTGGQMVVQGADTILEFPLKELAAGRDPVISFVWNADEVLLVAGAAGVPKTLTWRLTSTPPDGPPLVFPSPVLISSDDGKRVLSIGADDRIRFIGAGGKVTVSGKTGALVSAARVVSQSPLRVLFGTATGDVGLWNGEEGTLPTLAGNRQKGVINGVDYSVKQNAVLASSDGNWARLWRLSPKTAGVASFDNLVGTQVIPAEAPVRSATFSPDGKLFILPIGTNTAKLYGTQNSPQPASLTHQDTVSLAAFSPDGTMLATADRAGRVYLWDLGGAPATIPPPTVLSGHTAGLEILLWAPDGSYLLSAGSDGLPLVWQRPRDRLNRAFNDLPFVLPSHPGGVTDAVISPDGKRIATVGADWVARVFPLLPTMRGTARPWGGPKISLGNDGDLALLTRRDMGSADFAGLFLASQPAGTKGLISRLNPDSLYINARWDYSLTPRATLRGTKVSLRKLDPEGRPTGPTIQAQPVDWGPALQSGYAFDLSPGAVKALDLKDNETIQVEVPLLSPIAKPAKKY